MVETAAIIESHIIIATSLYKMGIFCKISFDERGWLKRYVYVQLKVYSWWNTKRFSSPRQHKEGGGSCALEDKYLADATRRVLDFVLILSRYAVTRTNIYI